MPFRCSNCNSLFFKTLEVRGLCNSADLLYKKRCKRCKYKYTVRKDALSGQCRLISHEDWQAGLKLAGMRGQIVVSEYTRRISAASDRLHAYLSRIQQAEGRRHAP